MIISVPPIKQPKSDDEIIPESEAPVVNQSGYEYDMVPADGLVVPDDQYIVDPDHWFRNFDSNFEDLIKIKR